MPNAHASIAAEDLPYTVAASYAQCLIDTASRQGAQTGRLLAAARLRPEALYPPSRRIPLARMLALFEAASAETGDEAIGLHMGQHVQPRTFNALGYAAMSCSTLGEAIAMIPRYEGLVYDGGHTRVLSDGARTTISWRSGLPQGVECRALNEVIVAGWVSFGRWIAGGQAAELEEVCFTHDVTGDRRAYESFFGCPVRFAASENVLRAPSAITGLPLVQQDDELRALMERRAEALLGDLQSGPSHARLATQHIQEVLPSRAPQIAEIAARMNMSERTLRRKLGAEGRSFKGLVAAARQDLARHYLMQTHLAMTEIALLLGYSEQSAFAAAFRQWFGQSPSSYRNQQLRHSQAH